MKIFICCLVAGLYASALADVKNVEESIVEKNRKALASDKSSDSKPKRDASLLSGVYHGPSYKYLPPTSISSYDSYPGSIGSSAGYSGGHISGVSRGHNHFGYSLSGHRGAFNGVGYAATGGYHGSAHQTGHGPTQYSGGFKSNVGATFGHGGHSYATGHGYSSTSGVGYKPQSIGGANTGTGSGYHNSNGPFHGFSSSHGSGLADVHHGDHVHNGAQEHVFVISSGPSGFGNPHGAGSYEAPSASYLPPVQQHPLPSSSYSVPVGTVGDSYNTKYHTQASPAYAAGQKGLGHFGFTANKPQVLHTSITGSSFKQPSYSKAPFKPSEFLGAKYEGSAHSDATNQQYLPPSGVGSDATGYDYHIPSGPSINYQEPSYQNFVEVQESSVNEPNVAYLPPQNNEGSFNESPSAPSGNYLPPSSSYGVPYTH